MALSYLEIKRKLSFFPFALFPFWTWPHHLRPLDNTLPKLFITSDVLLSLKRVISLKLVCSGCTSLQRVGVYNSLWSPSPKSAFLPYLEVEFATNCFMAAVKVCISAKLPLRNFGSNHARLVSVCSIHQVAQVKTSLWVHDLMVQLLMFTSNKTGFMIQVLFYKEVEVISCSLMMHSEKYPVWFWKFVAWGLILWLHVTSDKFMQMNDPST